MQHRHAEVSAAQLQNLVRITHGILPNGKVFVLVSGTSHGDAYDVDYFEAED